jgi:hypothetical protein
MVGGDCLEIKKRRIGEMAFSYLSGSGMETLARGRSNLWHFGRVFGERYAFS